MENHPSWFFYGNEFKYEPFNFDLSKEQEQRALDLHKKSIVFDCHASGRFRDSRCKVIAEHGITVLGKQVGGDLEPQAAIRSIFQWNQMMKRNKDYVIGPVTNIEDVYKAKKEGKTAYIYSLNNTIPFGIGRAGEIQWVELFYKLGIRHVQLTHSWRSLVADACGELPSQRATRSGHIRTGSDAGLSAWGEEVVDEMNRVGMIIDVSHVGDRSTMEAIERSKIVEASHSNSRSVSDSNRNMTDEAMKAVAEKDGVIGVVALTSMVNIDKVLKGTLPDINDLLDHVDYMVKLVGVDHVGVGFDHIDMFTVEGSAGMALSAPHIYGPPYPVEGTTRGGYPFPIGIGNLVQFLNFTRGLVAREYSDSEIQKIIGLNWMRLFKKIL